MTLFFDTPKARTTSAWRQAPWQISCAVNIRKARWSFSACPNTGFTPQKYVHWPFSRTTLIESLMRVAPSGMSGNNAWGMVPSSWCVPGDLNNHGRYHFYFPPPIIVGSDEEIANLIPAGA